MSERKKLDAYRRAIEARKIMLIKFVPFAYDIVMKRGRIIGEKQHGSHTEYIRILERLGRFSFKLETGHNSSDAATISIWHQLQYPIEDDMAEQSPTLKVSFPSLSFFDVKTCTVEVFRRHGYWHRALRRTIKNRKRIEKRIDRTRAVLEKEGEMEEGLQGLITELNAEARRLGF